MNKLVKSQERACGYHSMEHSLSLGWDGMMAIGEGISA